jgi:hypothetical protein
MWAKKGQATAIYDRQAAPPSSTMMFCQDSHQLLEISLLFIFLHNTKNFIKICEQKLGCHKKNLFGLTEQKNIIFHEDIYTLYYYNLNYIYGSISMAVLCYNIKQFKMGLYAKLQI